ncbi:MAG: 4'-phosphopantetheinyl transferase family protein [Dehalococcoidia bacterium]
MRLTILPREVHVWQFSLALPEARVRQLQGWLSADEVERAKRYHFKRDRSRFIARRAFLRTALGCYLDLAPAELSFGYGPFGKPVLAKNCGRDFLSFNLSDSADRALIAITDGAAVGVDLEKIAPEFATEEISRQYFSDAEVGALRALPVEQRTTGFFLCWTRKEAYIKAKGYGLAMPLADFAVSLTPGEPAALLSTRTNPQEVNHWGMHSLDLGPDYAAALCVAGRGQRVKFGNWPEGPGDYC